MPIVKLYEDKEILHRVDANETKEKMCQNIDQAMKDLGLDRLSKKKEILGYLKKEVDPYIQSLIEYLILKRP